MNMRRAAVLFGMAGTVVFLLAQSRPVAAGKPTKPADLAVRTVASDVDLLGVPYTIQSDALGAYVNGRDNVVSVLMANVYNNLYNGDWQMDASASSVRRVAITLAPWNAIGATQPGYTIPPNPPFWGTSYEAVRVIDKCTEFGKSVLTMSAGSAITCPLLVRWDAGASYRLDMGTPVEAPESTPAYITCNAADALGCADWFIDPIPSMASDGSSTPGLAIARLVRLARNGAATNLGDFYLTYHFHITRP
jgi:hypothetical protein